MEAERSETSLPADEANQEFRVHVTSKRQVIDQINRYGDVLRTALDGQTGVSEETRRALLQELLADFEAAVQDNVLVNGQPWDQTPDVEEAEDLETLLDDAIVEASRRRRTYPRKILPHVVHALKAQRKLLGLYEHAVQPLEVARDPGQESLMKDLSAAAPGMVKQAIQVIKSINTLQKQAEGLREILHMNPSPAALEIHGEVFGFDGRSDAPLPPGPRAARNRQPIKRAVEEAGAANCYVPLSKKAAGEDKPERSSTSEHNK